MGDIKKPILKITFLGLASIDGPGTGGAARVKDMVKIFNNLGIAVDLISYAFYSNKFKIEKKQVSPSLSVITIHVPEKLPKFLKFFSIVPLLYYGYKSSKRTDAIFADYIAVVTSFPAFLLKKINRKILLLDLMDVSSDNWIDIFHKFNIGESADIVYAISPFLFNKAKNEYHCKNVVYLPIFIDPNQFSRNSACRIMMRERLEIQDNVILIGYIGSYWYVEGVPILIDVFNELAEEHRNIRLLLMGKMDNSSSFDNIPEIITKSKVKERIILIPPQPREKVPDFLSACDILCSPKIDCEINAAANPVKIVEYLASGIPTVASGIGGTKDIITHGMDGLLVKPGDKIDLKEMIEWLLTNQDEAKIIGQKGIQTIIQKYSYDSVGKIIQNSLAECDNLE